MVLLEYRPYLFALIALTVIISLWEIAYVQWDYRDNSFYTKDPSLHAEVVQSNSNRPSDGIVFPTRSVALGSRIAELNERRKDGGGGGNRGILSSGKFTSDLSMSEDHHGGAGASSALEIIDWNSSRRDPQDHKSDFRTLIDMKDDFKFLINQKACPRVRSTLPLHPNDTVYSASGGVTEESERRLVMILVHSAPLNFRKRLTIRQTWGNHPDPAMKVYFLLGSVPSAKLQFKLEMENKLFGDLIQGNFVDAYRNMTYKHVMALKWFTYFCHQTPILLKTDDDVFVNTRALMEYVRENVNGIRDRRDFVMCKVMQNGKVKRSYRSKWRVSPREYPKAQYPPYCPGFTILFSGDVVQKLYIAAQRNHYFWIDDVHVTGTLMQEVNGTLSPFRDVYFKKTKRKRLSEPYVRNMPLFTDPDLVEAEIRDMWSMVDTKGVPKLGPPASPIAFDDTVEILAMGIESERSESGSGLSRRQINISWMGLVILVVCYRGILI